MATKALLDFGDGRNRELKITMRAIIHFKETYGKPIAQVRVREAGQFAAEIAVDHECMMHVLWAALLADEPETTLENVLDLTQAHVDAGGDIQKIAEAVGAAFDESGLFEARAKPDKKGKKKDPNVKGETLN